MLGASPAIPKEPQILQSFTDVEWLWTQRLGTITEFQGQLAFETGGVIRRATGGIIGERPIEMQMLGPLDYIGPGEAKALVSGVLLLKGGTVSLAKLFPKHHIFPRALRPFFAQAGINIDKYTIRLPLALHHSIHGNAGGPWLNAWRQFFRNNPNATAEEIHRHAGQLLYQFQIPGGPIIPY